LGSQVDPEILEHSQRICDRARAYGLRPEIVAEILRREKAQYRFTDWGQDVLVKTNLFFRLIARSANDPVTERIYRAHIRADLDAIERHTLNRFRNHKTHWMFHSVGPA